MGDVEGRSVFTTSCSLTQDALPPLVPHAADSVLSEASLQSEWVMTELRKARKAERQSGQRKLFPVRLVDMETLRDWECFDADSGKDLAVELREYFIPDFSHWKEHEQFEAAFAHLLKDLKAETGSA